MSRRSHRTMCPMNCHPTYCGMVVEIEGDHVVAVHGDRENPDSRGFLCVRGRAAGEIVDSPDRVLAPLVRERREPGAWRQTTWDEALDRVAAAIRQAGPAATALWAGHGVFVNGVGSQLAARFAHMAGAQWWRPAMVCWGLGGLGFGLTGVTEVNSMDDMAEHADLVLLWGANLASQPNTAPRLVAARRRGARVVAIDVRDTEAFAHADETFRVRPGTDAALALALMHVIIGEGLHDAAFVAGNTAGFEELAAHVRTCTPEWAEAETGIPAERIRGLARTYAGTRRSMILAGGSSMHKSGNGWHAARAHGMGMGDVVPPRREPLGDREVPSEMSSIAAALARRDVRVLVLLGT